MSASIAKHTSIARNSLQNADGLLLRRPAVLLSIIALISFLLYLSTLSFEFVWDDHMQVESNPLVLSWKNIPRAFENNLWFQVTPEGQGSYYRPFFIVWSVANHSLFGSRPWGWHLSNLLLHIVACCLVFAFLRRVNVEYWSAAIATLLFAVHPVHIEPVAWVSAGADILAAVLYLLTFLIFLRARDGSGRQRILWMLGSWVLFACALLTKEMALTFPIIIVLYLWLFPRQDARRRMFSRLGSALLASLPYVVLNLLYLAQRVRVLHGFAQTSKNYGAVTTLMTLPVVLMNDLRVLMFPTGLTGFYYTAYVRNLSFARFVLPTIALVALAILLWWWSKRDRDPLIMFFGLWIPLCLIPVLYLPTFQPGDFIRDRYLYLPSIGFAFLLAKAIRRLPLSVPAGASPWLQPAVVAVIFAAFAAGVVTQQAYWANDLLVFYRGYTLYPENTTAVKYLGVTFNRQGDVGTAMRLLKQAISADESDAYSHWALSVVYSEFRQDQQARQELETAVNLSPRYFLQTPDGLTNLGIALATCHEYRQAETALWRAIEIEPESSSSLLYLGLVLLRTDRPGEAEVYLKKAAAVEPEGFNINWALGMLAQLRGDRASAVHWYSEELRYHPDNRGAQVSLAALRAGK